MTRTWELSCMDCDFEKTMESEKSEAKRERVDHERKEDHVVFMQPLD